MYVYESHVCLVPHGGQRRVPGPPKLELQSCEQPCRFKKLNLGLLEEQSLNC